LKNSFIEVGITVELVGLIKMHSNETYMKVHIGIVSSGTLPIRNSLSQRVVV
jgi:predicted NUDIX family phosphoesterase